MGEKRFRQIFEIDENDFSICFSVRYNASEYFADVVAQSGGWLSALQDWVSVFLTCSFAFVSIIILWNSVGSVLWFFSLR